MSWLIWKITIFAGCFMFMTGSILPWLISNDVLPVWLDIILCSFCLMGVWLGMEWLNNQIFKKVKDASIK